MSRYGVSRYGMSRYGVSRYGVSRYGVSRYGMSRYGVSRLPGHLAAVGERDDQRPDDGRRDPGDQAAPS
ncbi:hypothetical protein, partial [Actinoplanes sp. ATCC 53533]|uniref:hypothetical protein n=1 Tax=Actinoplanes sp. ATCC 53533 TaxID=1288362 RepID=UPI001F47225D